jgi:hypothetical protein
MCWDKKNFLLIWSYLKNILKGFLENTFNTKKHGKIKLLEGKKGKRK